MTNIVKQERKLTEYSLKLANNIQKSGLTSSISISEAIKTPMLSNYKSEKGKQNVAKIIEQAFILKMQEFTGIQLAMIVEMIVSNFGHIYTIGDLVLALKRGVNQNYGKIYGKVISYDIICEWLLAYSEEKTAEAQKNAVKVNTDFDGVNLSEAKNLIIVDKETNQERPIDLSNINKLLEKPTNEDFKKFSKQYNEQKAKEEMKKDYELVQKGDLSEEEFKKKWS